MKKTIGIFLMFGIVLGLISYAVFSFKIKDCLEVAIYATGSYSDSYYVRINNSGEMVVRKGIRGDDDLRVGKSFVVKTEEKERINLSSDEVENIFNLVEAAYIDKANAVIAPDMDEKQPVYETDTWEVQLLYKGKKIRQNFFRSTETVNDLVDKVISKPTKVKINLRGFA